MSKTAPLPSLKPGDTIGIVSPSKWAPRAWLANGKKLFEQHGYKVVIHPQNYLKHGVHAGNDAARAQALMEMFADPEIDGIICSRGGSGAVHLLDRLDYKIIGRNPKVFIGFSDITLLLNAITKQCGFSTFHGPMLWNFAHYPKSASATDLFAVVENGKKIGTSLFRGIECIRPGRTEGTLVGGNLLLLQSLIGTPYEWTAKDKILFIEEVVEPLYKVDRALRHLHLAGKFDGVRAVLVGEMIGVSDSDKGFRVKGEPPYGRTLRQIVMDNVPKNVPVGFHFPCGHGKYLTTLPIGARVKLTLNTRAASIEW